MGLDSILLTGLINLTCNTLPADERQQQLGCETGIEVSAKTSGAYEAIRKREKKIEKKIKQEAKENINATFIDVLAFAALSGRLAMGERVSFRLGKGSYGERYRMSTDLKEVRFDVVVEF